MQLSAYSMMTYESTRKAKMYQINMRTVMPDYLTVLDYLKGIHVHTIHIRFFYTRFTEDINTDLLANYPEKHLQAILMYSLINNIPITIKTLFCDANTYIFDVLCSSDEQTIKALIRNLLKHNSCSFTSKVEIKTIGDDETLFFLLKGYRSLKYPDSLLKSLKGVDCFAPVSLKKPITLELLDNYYFLLKLNYTEFYKDVQNRFVTVWCFREDMGEFLIKRNFLGKPLYFLPTFEEMQPILDFEQIITIVPNNMPKTAHYPVELIIDLDTQKVSYEIVCSISNRLEKWLNKKGFYCLRRLTGSWYAGQHFILPINWTEPYILTGSDSSIEVYKRKYSQHILCDSVRSMAVLLSLAFQVAKFCSLNEV